MQNAEAQHKHRQSQPTVRQGKGASLESPQSEQIAQLEAMIDSSPQAARLAQFSAMVNNSPQVLAQRRMMDSIHNSPRMAAQRRQLDGIAGKTAQREEMEEPLQPKVAQREEAEELMQPKAIQCKEEEELIQGKFEAASSTQLKEEAVKPNNTGLPDNLKSGIESLSGMSMDNVRVHYNSSQPAQLNALAYAQGTDIHVAPGQEQHLPHEAWHVVQQAQGRVQPTMQMKEGVPVNDDKSLEHEADVMGVKAVSVGVVQGKSIESDLVDSPAVQMKKAKMVVTGLTHLVYPLSGEEIGQSGDLLISEKVDYLHNEGAEVSEPSMIWIETNSAKLSRRGPNQEAFNTKDVNGPPHYVWYTTYGSGQRPDQDAGPYIREDTLKVLDKDVPGKDTKFNSKSTDINLLRIAAETLISEHYPVPMTKSSLGAVFLDDEKAYRAYATRVALAQVGEEDDQESKEFKLLVSSIANTNALTELGEVHINNGKVGTDGLGTVIHELMHFYGMQTSFISDVCGGRSDGFNEGVTEYFAQKVTFSVGILRTRVYAAEVRQVNEIVGLVGENLLLKAYFRGETGPLINALKKSGRWDNEKNRVLVKEE